MDGAVARRELRRGLTLAASGELGAIRAYLGHRRSLRYGADRDLLVRILKDETRHSRRGIEMLGGRGGQRVRRAERKLTLVGGAIAAFCRVGGWFLPMVGAARLECDNIVEYEILARLAWWAGEHALLDPLLHLAEVEWDHEAWLRERAMTHALWRLVPLWPAPRSRSALRADFASFLRRPTTVRRRFSLLVR
jgi:rubrerythrin